MTDNLFKDGCLFPISLVDPQNMIHDENCFKKSSKRDDDWFRLIVGHDSISVSLKTRSSRPTGLVVRYRRSVQKEVSRR